MDITYIVVHPLSKHYEFGADLAMWGMVAMWDAQPLWLRVMSQILAVAAQHAADINKPGTFRPGRSLN